MKKKEYQFYYLLQKEDNKIHIIRYYWEGNGYTVFPLKLYVILK